MINNRCHLLLRVTLVVFSLVGLTAGSVWAEVNLSNLASVSFEYDDNVYLAGRDLTSDGLGRIFCDFGVHWAPTPAHLLYGAYEFGGKLYINESEQDTAINQLQLGYTNYSISSVYIGGLASGKLRNVRDGQEDYFKLITEAFAGKRFGSSFNAEINAEYSQFDFRNFNYYDYWTQAYGMQLRYDHERIWTLGTGYQFSRKTFPFNALQNVGPEEGNVLLLESDERRLDTLHEVHLFGRYQTILFDRVPFLLNGSYLLQINDSNSYGDSYINHRFMLGLSQDLFEGTNLHILGIFQLRDSSEKVLIPHSYSIEEDDENYNQVQVRITHGFTNYLRAFVGYSRYWTIYEHDELNFVKNLYALGLTVSF